MQLERNAVELSLSPSKRQPVRGAYLESGISCLGDLVGAAPKPYVAAAPLFLRVVSAVETTHRAQARMGNLDPRKILLHGSGKVELCVRDSRSQGITLSLASLKYAAPELVMQAEEEAASAAADSYALGFMFYEILLGRDSFQRQFAEAARRGELGWMRWHADSGKRAEPLHTLLGAFPRALSFLIGGMMEKDKGDRTTELHEVAEKLAGFLRATASISGLAALRGDGRKDAVPGPKARKALPGSWSGLTAAVKDGVRSRSGSG